MTSSGIVISLIFLITGITASKNLKKMDRISQSFASKKLKNLWVLIFACVFSRSVSFIENILNIMNYERECIIIIVKENTIIIFIEFILIRIITDYLIMVVILYQFSRSIFDGDASNSLINTRGTLINDIEDSDGIKDSN